LTDSVGCVGSDLLYAIPSPRPLYANTTLTQPPFPVNRTMRALTLVAFALVVAALGADAQTAGSVQADARALEDRWQNCSRVTRGRLLAAHPSGDQFILDGVFTGTYQGPALLGNSTATATYNISTEVSPCLPRELSLNNETGYIALTIGAPVSKTYTYTVVASTVTFHMPQNLGEVATFAAKYTQHNNEGNFTFLTLTVQCGNTNSKSARLSLQDNQAYLTLTDINACPRFPYTNENLPSGGVAALIVTIVICVIQFSICGWYHKTVKVDVPFADRDNYQNLDH
jgi:hypothetical protein